MPLFDRNSEEIQEMWGETAATLDGQELNPELTVQVIYAHVVWALTTKLSGHPNMLQFLTSCLALRSCFDLKMTTQEIVARSRHVSICPLF